jgi:nucleoid-associated protein YgaU
MKLKTGVRSGWWYTVQSGDSLWKIAQRYYGDGNLWTAIYNYRNNSRIIGPNPNVLRAGISIELW